MYLHSNLHVTEKPAYGQKQKRYVDLLKMRSLRTFIRERNWQNLLYSLAKSSAKFHQGIKCVFFGYD